MRTLIRRACAFTLLCATAPAFAFTSVVHVTLNNCQPVAPYQAANGALVCNGTLDATQQGVQMSFTVSNGHSVSNVKYIIATRHPTVLWFAGSTGTLTQPDPFLNSYTLSIQGAVSNASGVVKKDAAGNPVQFVAEQHLQLVTPLGIAGPGTPLFEPLNGPAFNNTIAY